MCGICGFVYRDPEHPVDENRLRAMMARLSHRGPDASGTYIGPGGRQVALGHTRLAVIDLETGDQPMHSPTGRTTIVYNGECYNFRELRAQLKAKGVTFRTQSDTEVVAALVAEHGVDAPELMNGQFAFAAWDRTKRQLLLARDSRGQKPLYVYTDDDKLVFASSLGALLAYGGIPVEIDARALDLYLVFGYVPGTETVFKNVRRVAPGGFHISDGRRGWYESPWGEPPPTPRRVTDDELHELMTDAVRKRLISDVPLGAWLSGGIDSSIIVALMSELVDEPVRTFAIGFGEPLYDELEYARAVAERCGTDHHEFIVKPECDEALDALVPLFGEPFADSSAIPTWYLARETRGHVTVALSGDGGDELFGGYDRYRAMRLARLFDTCPGFMRRIPKFMSTGVETHEQRSQKHRIKRFLQALEEGPIDRYVGWMSVFDRQARLKLTTDGFRQNVEETWSEEGHGEDYLRGVFKLLKANDWASLAMRVDRETYLPGDLLVKTDVASMAWGLEVRCPFLDPRVVALARRMPTRQKLSMFTGKRILRRAFRDKLPRKVRKRKKMGFGVPLGRWFRGKLKDMLSDVLLSRKARERGILRPEAVRALIDEHQARHADHSARLYALLFLERWFREFID